MLEQLIDTRHGCQRFGRYVAESHLDALDKCYHGTHPTQDGSAQENDSPNAFIAVIVNGPVENQMAFTPLLRCSSAKEERVSALARYSRPLTC